MLQHVNKVLVATGVPASYTAVDSLKDGELALFDENKVLIKSATEAEKACALYIGLCIGSEKVYDQEGTETTKAIINYSMPIQKGSHPSMVFTPFVDKAEDIATITATNVTVEIGHRYVLRIVYKDIYEAPGQFTHTYEVIAKTTSATDLVEAFKNKINKHKQARVVATSSAAVLTLTAKEKNDSEGLHPVNLYSQVSMDVFMWTTIPSGLLSNVMYPISNLTIAKTQGTPGRGNAKIVRDRENANLGYEGIQYRENAIYPYIAPELRVDLSAEYDTLTLEWDNLYLSNDNQYIKTTPLSAEIYVNSGELESSTFKTALEAFVAKA